MQKNPNKLKRAVVKEELVAICGDFIDAIILNQFIYWSERVKDFDKFISEEIERAKRHGIEKNMTPCNGWIYKTSEELASETMLSMSPSSMRRHIKNLIELGYLDERQNPEYKWDQTKQYRVNLTKIQIDLIDKGYTLEGYPLPILKIENAISKIENADFKIEIQTSETEIQISKSKNQDEQNRNAIPEITTETTTENNYLIDIWEKALSIIREKVPEQTFNTWFSSTSARIEGNTLVIVAPNSFNQDWLESRYSNLIKDTLSLIYPDITELRITT